MVGFWGVEENIRPPPLRRKKSHKIRTKYDSYFSDYSEDEVTFTSDEEEEKREIKRMIEQQIEEKKQKEEQLKMLEEEMRKQAQARLSKSRRYTARKNWMSSSSESETSTDEDDNSFLDGSHLMRNSDLLSYGHRSINSREGRGRFVNHSRTFQPARVRFSVPDFSSYSRYLTSYGDYTTDDSSSSSSGSSFNGEDYELDDDSISGFQSVLRSGGGNALRFAPIDVFPGFVRYETSHFDILSPHEAMLTYQHPYIHGYESLSWFLCQNLMFRCPIPESVYMMTEEWSAYWMSLSTKYYGPGYFDGTLHRCSCMVQVGSYVYKQACSCQCGAYMLNSSTGH